MPGLSPNKSSPGPRPPTTRRRRDDLDRLPDTYPLTLRAAFCSAHGIGSASTFHPVSLFDLKVRFFVPTHGLQSASCRDAVKAGRRAAGPALAGASRPRLDGDEHEAKLG